MGHPDRRLPGHAGHFPGVFDQPDAKYHHQTNRLKEEIAAAFFLLFQYH
jgi:hypothetical protein